MPRFGSAQTFPAPGVHFGGKAGRGSSLSRKELEQELGSEEGGPQYCAVRVS